MIYECRLLIKITMKSSEMGKELPKACLKKGSQLVQCRVSRNLRHNNNDFERTI